MAPVVTPKVSTVSSIEMIRNVLEKHFKSSAELFPDFTTCKQIDVVKTSSAILNAITIVGGFPRGRVTEIFGPNGSGKTTIAIESAVSCQKECPDLAVLYLDFEHALDVAYAHHLGLNLDPNKFIICQPDSFEQGEAIVKGFLVNDKDGAPKNLLSAVIVDSAAAMTPSAELMGDVEGPTRIGLQAQLMSRFLGRATKWITRGTKPALIILNQTRTKIDVNNPANNGETSAGGHAIKFYTTIRLQLELPRGEGEEGRSTESGNRGTDQVYRRHRVRVTCIKNKVAPPWMRGSLIFEFGTGINNLVSVADLSEKKLGLMAGAGFFKYQGDTPSTSFSCRGREEFVKILEGNPALFKEIEDKLLLAIKAEHAKTLGLNEIKAGGAAKSVEGDVVLESTIDDGSGMLVEELQ